MRTHVTSALLLGTFAFVAPVDGAELVGRAVLPAATFSAGPTSGQFITSANGQSVPFTDRQPVQGFSGVLFGPTPGTFLVMVDNGFGAKTNSADALLRAYAVRPDFRTARGGSGEVRPVDRRTGAPLSTFTPAATLQLNDAARRVGFGIVADSEFYPNGAGTVPVDAAVRAERLLTGADFDLESLRRAPDGTLWFGEEFGPFLLHTDANGKLLDAPIPLPNVLALGTNPLVQSPSNPLAAPGAANLPNSKGFEGMAINPSGTRLYALLEGPLTTDGRRNRLLIHEFDIASRSYTGRVFQYRMDATFESGQAIGDLTAINDREFLVIERDNNAGDPNVPAFGTAIARHKRIYRIDLDRIGADGYVRKQLVVDLLDIDDPRGLGGEGTSEGVYTFPYVTIEDVLPLSRRVLLVINDNNYPFSVGRTPATEDSTEFILIRLDEPLDLDRRLLPRGHRYDFDPRDDD